MNRNLRCLVFLLCFPLFYWAQESVKYSGENAAFFNAEELFTKAQFAAAKQEFRVFIHCVCIGSQYLYGTVMKPIRTVQP